MTEKVSPEEQEALKRAIYEKMSPRRRKWVDKVGYENWDPFQPPQDPIDLRTDGNEMTAQQLVDAFLATVPNKRRNNLYDAGAFEVASGIVSEHEKYLGMYDFMKWYIETLGGKNKIES